MRRQPPPDSMMIYRGRAGSFSIFTSSSMRETCVVIIPSGPENFKALSKRLPSPAQAGTIPPGEGDPGLCVYLQVRILQLALPMGQRGAPMSSLSGSVRILFSQVVWGSRGQGVGGSRVNQENLRRQDMCESFIELSIHSIKMYRNFYNNGVTTRPE